MDDYELYFRFRRVQAGDYSNYRIPAYLHNVFGGRRQAKILDFGCGFGHLPGALRKLGFTAVEGLDISPQALAECQSQGIPCHDGRDENFFQQHQGCYDFVHLSHVVEHFPKEEIIPLLRRVRSLLKPEGAAVIIVPNAQSNTGAYWAYEDFTHYTLFTAGSLYYVLMAAGYSGIEVLDAECLEGLRPWKRWPKWGLLQVYKLNYKLWNRVTSSVTHRPSPSVFGFEVKALAHR